MHELVTKYYGTLGLPDFLYYLWLLSISDCLIPKNLHFQSLLLNVLKQDSPERFILFATIHSNYSIIPLKMNQNFLKLKANFPKAKAKVPNLFQPQPAAEHISRVQSVSMSDCCEKVIVVGVNNSILLLPPVPVPDTGKQFASL